MIPTDKTVGFTCGAFDLLHAGHVLMLKEVREKCDFLIVGLQTDPSLDRPESKHTPVQSIKERRIQLLGCKYVDMVIEYDTEADLYRLLKQLKPDRRFLGADWMGKQYTGYDLPIETIFNSRDHSYSSSDLRERIISSTK